MEVRDKRSRRWFWMHNEIIDSYGEQLGPYGLSVYMALARRVDNDTQVTVPTLATLAKGIGISRRKVEDTIKQLAELKLVEIEPRFTEHGDRTSNAYYLLDFGTTGGEVVHAVHYPSALSAGGVVHAVHSFIKTSEDQDSFIKTEKVLPNGSTSPSCTARPPTKIALWAESDLWLKIFLETQQLADVPFSAMNAPTWWENVAETTNGLNLPFLTKEFAKMGAWLIENKRRRPAKPVGWKRFVRSWLERAYESDRRKSHANQNTGR